eukprot:TRINITY_DN1331_c0_g1_i1.p1 TRINITY_DN1331_c0_g1~~TRINITY_DN1331_c0_g1_i1.p1  ORF type:complete len:417 (+),score=121.81 TRINITY_DN1331_c0_g1_i1:64-1314(+)
MASVLLRSSRKLALSARAATYLTATKPQHKSIIRAALPQVQRRYLNLQEYQSKSLLQEFGVAIQQFRVAETPEEAEAGGRELKADELVVKAQILAGGRGKGTFNNGFKGGVHVCKTADEAKKLAASMLNNALVTKQTKAEGVLVRKVMIAKSIDISREVYFCLLLDPASKGPVMVGSPKGGMDIEAVAEETPQFIFKDNIDVATGMTKEQALKMAKNLEFTGEKIEMAADQMLRLYQLFVKKDATQIEINPLAETPDGQVICVDAKLNFDDNASFRQKDVYVMNDTSEQDAREVAAEQYNLNYIGLEGNIGCLVNGAGLAMATMDIIKMNGGSPANFLDVGGSANEEQVTQAFRILTADPQVKAILVNIFGGIMKCDIIANGERFCFFAVALIISFRWSSSKLRMWLDVFILLISY